MPSTSRTLEGSAPSYGDTPPSTRPSSSASSASSGLPHTPSRTLSMDSLSTSGGAAPEKVEHIPTRTVGTGPKVNTKAMIFVKTGPAKLYVSATEQMKKAENIKNMRKVVQEEEEPEWQQSSSSSSSSSAAQDDWQSNLDKWKQKRNRNNKVVLDRVLEVKKHIVESEQNPPRRRSSRVGLRNVVVHDDDDNDLSGLGLTGDNGTNDTIKNQLNTDDHTSINNSRNEPSRVTRNTSSSTTTTSSSSQCSDGSRIKSSTRTSHGSSSHPTSLSSPPTSLTADGGSTAIHTKDILLDHDNKDAKSDAGFCTGSDTGSDGVFPEDNISDTSSALGDKKETHDSLLDAAVPVSSKDEDIHHSASSSADRTSSGTAPKDQEYTFDKAIEGYKQYAENSFKKRTSSMTSLTSVSSSSSRLEDRTKFDKDSNLSAASAAAAAAAASKDAKIEDKLDFFKKEMDKEFSKPPPKPIVVMREKSPKIDVTKRKSMFEAGQSISTMNLSNLESNSNLDKRRSPDMTASTGNLRNKVASFENIDVDGKKQKGVTPPRDTKFKEKLANFSTKGTVEDTTTALTRKKTPEKDKNFHQKLASFSKIQNGGSIDESKTNERRSSIPAQLNNSTSLKSKIASFEQLDQNDQVTDFRLSDGGSKTREKSVSMECLSRSSTSTRRLESRFSRGSVDRLDEEPPADSPPSSWGRSSSSHQPRSPVKTSYESRFSSESRSYQSKSPEKRPSAFGSTSTSSSVLERKSQLEKSSSETISSKSSEASRSSRPLPLGPEVPPLDFTSHSKPEAPIGTSSPRENANNSTTTDLRTGVECTTSSSSSQSVLTSFSSSISTSTSSKISRGFVGGVQQAYEDDAHYDDVLNINEPPSLASSSEGDRMRYTDEDINEVIQEVEGPSRTRGAAPLPATKDVLETKTSFSSSHFSSSKVSQPPLGPPPSLPSTAPPPKPMPSFGFKSSSTLEPLPATPAYAGSDTSSKTSAKEELRKRRSDFLGTSRFSEDVASPPPDLDALLRQQREADKQMLEARKSLSQSTQQVMSSIDSRHQALSAASSMDSTGGVSGRDRYTWQDRLRDDSSQPSAALNDTDDGYGYQNVTSAAKTSTSESSVTETSTSETSTSETSTSETSTSETSATKTGISETCATKTSASDNSSLLPDPKAAPFDGQTDSVVSEQTIPEKGSVVADQSPLTPDPDHSVVTTTDAPLSDPDHCVVTTTDVLPSDAVKGTFTVLTPSSSDNLPEKSSVVPSLPSTPVAGTEGGAAPAAEGSVSQEPKKLAELEAEMLRHDRTIISRTLSQQQQSVGGVASSAPYGDVAPANDTADAATVTYDDVLAPADGYGYQNDADVSRQQQQSTLDTSVTSGSTDDYYEKHRQSQLKQQFLQQQHHHQQQVSEATYQNEEYYQQHLQQQQQQQQQQLAGNLSYSGADYYQQHRDQQQQQYPEVGPEKPMRTYNPCYDSSAPLPEPLPRKKKPPPPPEEDRYETINANSSAQQQQLLSKQSRVALSATPRSRITDGESWIKRKPEANRDYNKHWLYQEAEQRRLEQRDTRNSQKKDQKLPHQQHQQMSSHTSAPYSTSSSSYSSTNITRVESRSTDALQRSSSSDFGSLNRALDPQGRTTSADHGLNRGPPVHETAPHTNRPPQEPPVNRTTDPNAWRNRAMTYQPIPPGGPSPQAGGSADKPLPESIINTLTQRVNNKSRPGSASNSSGRPSPYSTGTSTSGYGTIGYSNDDNYHDYMNADAISNMQQQQQQQQQQQSPHYHPTYYAPQQQMDSSEPPNHQQQYNSNSHPSPQSSFNNNNTNTISNGNHEHYAQHLQVSPTASLPLSSSSSSTISTQQQQQQYYSKSQHSYTNNNSHQSPKSPSSSPPSGKVLPPPPSATGPTAANQNTLEERQRLLSVSGKKKCSHCNKELGRGAAMIIESLRLYYHIPCFVCCVCGVQLSNGKKGADVNVRNHGVHCRNCYSNDQGVKFSEV